ncbi:MAG: DUF4301 family protein [Marinilabiliales bacterium]|nr:DUF4301 family protein [Marinilabiliales bacterium]
MFTPDDQHQITSRGSSMEEISRQIEHFKKGFPFLHLVDAAGIGHGIVKPDEAECLQWIHRYEAALKDGLCPVKFVPASGAASRMFQSLFSFQEEATNEEKAAALLMEEKFKAIRQFFDRLRDFAFYPVLESNLKPLTNGQGTLRHLDILDFLLSPKGLNYGFLPKGLLDFHLYGDISRTPAEEHLVEGALYCTDAAGRVTIHFTVSPEHLPLFQRKCNEAALLLGKRYEVTYDISFSEQKPSTDTIAVDEHNQPFRTAEGKLLFRPGGHGALLENLNDLHADLIFVKNIDNVVPDRLKDETVRYKKALAGMLIEKQREVFDFLQQLESRDDSKLEQIIPVVADWISSELAIDTDAIFGQLDVEAKVRYLKGKLNRPIRVCGMVKNEGEPGGGPFWATQPDGTVALQVAESSQIDLKNPAQAALAAKASHFNPVDLVCGVRNYKGEKFNLPDFKDPETGFISYKSKDGKPLKAQELPGLWNGAMSDWITFFVEVPVITFNPVKTVNDLLRTEHQPL